MKKIMKSVVASATSMAVLLSAVTANICISAQAYTVLETPIVSEEVTFKTDNLTYSIIGETDSKTYNTSELVLGQKLSAGDILHYDDVNGVGSVANIINENGSFDIAFINENDYTLPWNTELVGIDGLTIYLAPENENIKYVDVRTLNVGDVIENDTYLLCYNYVTNGRVSPVFLPSYYEKYVGEGTIKLKAIDHEAKRVTLEAVMETVISGDTNGDGEINVADAVILQKFLSCAECELLSSSSADLNHDDTVNAFDMVLLRRQLLAE